MAVKTSLGDQTFLEAVQPSKMSKLLQLPPEIRTHIYEAVLGLPVEDHIAFLCLSHQIYCEGRESFFHRPYNIRSPQTECRDITSIHEERALNHITNLRLTVEELDASSMQPYLARYVAGLPIRYDDHPWVQEGRRIITSLQRFPNVKQLTIVPPASKTQTWLSGKTLENVLHWISIHYKRMEILVLAADTVSLDCLQAFAGLRSLHFLGFSTTNPEALGDMMAQMRSLQELVVIGPSPEHQWRERYRQATISLQSFSPSVLKRLQPLKRLSLCDLTDQRSTKLVYMTRAMATALFSHQDSLQELHLASVQTPSADVQTFLTTFIMSTSQLRVLTIGWPDLDDDFIDCLPSTIESIKVAVYSNSHAKLILRRLQPIQYRLPYLRRVKFDLINPVEGLVAVGDKQQVNFGLPVQQTVAPSLADPLTTSWTVSWGVWHYPVIGDT